MCAHRWTTTANAISPGLETETRDEVVQLVEGSVEREQHCASSRYLMFTIFEAITRLLTNSAFGLNNTSLWLREKKKKSNTHYVTFDAISVTKRWMRLEYRLRRYFLHKISALIVVTVDRCDALLIVGEHERNRKIASLLVHR